MAKPTPASHCKRAEATNVQPVNAEGAAALIGSATIRKTRPALNVMKVAQPSHSCPRGYARLNLGNIQKATPKINCVSQPKVSM